MALCSLGEQIDIHGGGIDLLYPHHESEIAQSEGATEKIPFAKYWIHTGAVMYQGQKMSKSIGNLILISDLLKNYSPNALRYVLLSHHYREPWEFHEDELKTASEKITMIEKVLSVKKNLTNNASEGDHESQFTAAMDNDLDTPNALDIIMSLAEKIRQKKTPNTQMLQKLLTTLGFSSF